MTNALYWALGITIALEFVFGFALILSIDNETQFRRMIIINLINLFFILVLFGMSHAI